MGVCFSGIAVLQGLFSGATQYPHFLLAGEIFIKSEAKMRPRVGTRTEQLFVRDRMGGRASISVCPCFEVHSNCDLSFLRFFSVPRSLARKRNGKNPTQRNYVFLKLGPTETRTVRVQVLRFPFFVESGAPLVIAGWWRKVGPRWFFPLWPTRVDVSSPCVWPGAQRELILPVCVRPPRKPGKVRAQVLRFLLFVESGAPW